MFKILGYRLQEQIFESTHSIVFRGTRESDNVPLIIKVLKEDYPSKQELNRYRQEFEIAGSLKQDGVIAVYAQEKCGNSLAIIMEDFGGESLKILSRNHPFGLGKALSLAVRISGILEKIHAQNIIHKDLNPSNIIYNAESDVLKIIDFGISSVLALETPVVKSPDCLEGTLAYMSPEQTARTNRVLDYRTDMYSLGVTCFELFTGSLPFERADPAELMHCHLALEPPLPEEFNPEISRNLSQVVLKLLAKNSEERYQTAIGLQADLKFCLKELESGEESLDFQPGCLDVSERFILPQKLYGRRQEMDVLLEAGKRAVAGPSEALLVSGYSGVGKTALIKEIFKPLAARRGYFIAGKFEQYHRNIPYSAVQSAMRGFIRLLLTENEIVLARWHDSLLEALGVNGRVLTDFIPELEAIIGEQPSLGELGPNESRNRFHLVFRNFMEAICQKQHPLVLFLDDLQWVDSASLELLKQIMVGSRYLFFIGAYRDNEVDPVHPLLKTLEELRLGGVALGSIKLRPLEVEHIREYVQDATLGTLEEAQELAVVLKNKTDGNPFFMGEFLKTLHRENLLTFLRESGRWFCDLNGVWARNISDNVVEMMAEQIENLEAKTREVLMAAACLGGSFDLRTLSIVCERTLKDTAQELWPALKPGLVLPLSDEYKIAALENILETDVSPVEYKFAHDRIQEAAYSLIPENDRWGAHLKAGRLLLKNTPQETLELKIFDIVDHLNKGSTLIEADAEIRQLAFLNLEAGRKARVSTAYEPALLYVRKGRDLLGPEGWRKDYELALAFCTEGTQAAYLAGHYNEMEELMEETLENSSSLMDEIKIYELKVISLQARNRALSAVEAAVFVLDKLGVSFPHEPEESDVLKAFAEIEELLSGRLPESLLSLPEMTDTASLAAMGILNGVITSTYQAAPGLFPLVALSMIRLTLEKGICGESTYGFICYGLLLLRIKNNIDLGYAFGFLGLELTERKEYLRFRARALDVFYGMIYHWKSALSNSINLCAEGYRIGLAQGDLEYAAFGGWYYINISYQVGRDLTSLEEQGAAYAESLGRVKQKTVLNFLNIWRQVILNLRYSRMQPTMLTGDAYDVVSMKPVHLAANDTGALGFLCCAKMSLNCIFLNYKECLEIGQEVQGYLPAIMGQPFFSHFYFYDALARLALCSEATVQERQSLLAGAELCLEKLEYWATFAPMNQLHKCRLIQAEIARIQGDGAQARGLYEASIQLARENEYLSDEAQAWETAGRFYLEIYSNDFAVFCLKNARYAYRRWGADAKVAQLDEIYPELLRAEEGASGRVLETTLSTSISAGSGAIFSLDIASVMKATRAISGEIQLNKLLKKMMAILLENAGAQKGFLLLEREGDLYAAARAVLEEGETTILDYVPLEDVDEIAVPIVHYTARTGESLVLNNEEDVARFASREFIDKYEPESILCLPAFNQGKLSCVLYLENNLVAGAFTRERLEMLYLLSAQIAVSIENAELYGNLESKVKERTRQLEAANHRLKDLDRIKNELFTNISHEIRTPLTLILSPLDMLLADEQEKGESERLLLLKSMVANGRKLLKQVNDLLELARLESGKMRPSYRQVEMMGFVRELAENFQDAAKNKNIRLWVAGPDVLFTAVDPEKFEKVILNLLGNALKFTDTGEIRVEILELENLIRLSVSDTGIGITPGEEQAIFKRFYRPVGGGPSGTGIGLSLAKEIVIMHDGSIRVEPSPEGGACFIVELPSQSGKSENPEYPRREFIDETRSAYVAALVDEGRGLEEGIGSYIGGENSVTGRAKDAPLLLIVEDNLDMNRYLASILSPYFRLLQVKNGVQGLDAALKNGPDLILSDVMMPEMDGVEMLIKLREYESMKTTPIVMLSARTELAQRLEGLTAGADDYIAKPFRPPELLLKIRNLLHKKAQFELGKHREREGVYADLHDYLGGSLTDMAIIVRQLKKGANGADPLMGQLEQNVQQAVINYRQCFAKIGDLDQLRDDFVDGLNLILLRRYTNAERDFSFSGDEKLKDVFSDRRRSELKNTLYAVIMEVATNDLKYGSGHSNWRLGLEETQGNFLLSFRAGTEYTEASERPGRGTGNIHQRIEQLNGEVNTEILNGVYSLNLKVPLN